MVYGELEPGVKPNPYFSPCEQLRNTFFMLIKKRLCVLTGSIHTKILNITKTKVYRTNNDHALKFSITSLLKLIEKIHYRVHHN